MGTEKEDHKCKVDDEVQKKKKNDTVVPARYLDDSILINIFARIPADMLHTNHFKYQCTQWRRMISEDYFMDIHAKNISQFKPGIIYMEQVGSLSEPRYLLKYMEFSRSEILRVRTLHDFGITKLLIKSSCNGLLVMKEDRPSWSCRIMNPVTKKQATFHAVENSSFCELVYVGMYKLVELYRDIFTNSYLRITTINSGEPPKDILVPKNCHGMYKSYVVYINGVFYWAVENHIVSFNLDMETFEILQTPDIGRVSQFGLLKLFGSLSLVERLYEIKYWNSSGTNFWSMVRGEWEKVFTLNYALDFDFFLDHANLLIYRDSHYQLAAYDVKTEKSGPVDDSKGLVREKHWRFCHKVHVNSFIDPLATIKPQSMA